MRRRRPATPDEELIGAQHAGTEHEITDATRVERMTAELAMGFRELADVKRAVSVFGSARTLPGSPEFELAVEVGTQVEAGTFLAVVAEPDSTDADSTDPASTDTTTPQE